MRYVFPYIDSNMYILVENGEALVIDPHISADADRYLKNNKVDKVTILLTHEHFDHTCGIPWFREHYNTQVVCQNEALSEKRQKLFCRHITISLILSDREQDKMIKDLEKEYPPYGFSAEETFESEYQFMWQGHCLHLVHSPGHSPASCLITMDEMYIFTGDSLIPDAEPTIRWPWSDAEAYRENVVPRLLSIAEECMIFPGHRNPVIMSQLVYENEQFMKVKD